jgi:hypothetical protein
MIWRAALTVLVAAAGLALFFTDQTEAQRNHAFEMLIMGASTLTIVEAIDRKKK